MPSGRGQGTGRPQANGPTGRILNEKARCEPKGVGEQVWGSRRTDLGRVKRSGGQSEWATGGPAWL